MGDAEKAAPQELRPRMSQRPADADDEDYGTLQRLGVHLVHTFVDLYVAFVTFGLYLFTFETLLLCVLSVGSVTFFTHWYTYHGACAPRQLAAPCAGLTPALRRRTTFGSGTGLRFATPPQQLLPEACCVRRSFLFFNLRINWTFFSFAVVFPLTFSLNEAFKRRELALAQLAQMKARSSLAPQG